MGNGKTAEAVFCSENSSTGDVSAPESIQSKVKESRGRYRDRYYHYYRAREQHQTGLPIIETYTDLFGEPNMAEMFAIKYATDVHGKQAVLNAVIKTGQRSPP